MKDPQTMITNRKIAEGIVSKAKSRLVPAGEGSDITDAITKALDDKDDQATEAQMELLAQNEGLLWALKKEAARRAYEAGLGASEWEAFMPQITPRPLSGILRLAKDGLHHYKEECLDENGYTVRCVCAICETCRKHITPADQAFLEGVK